MHVPTRSSLLASFGVLLSACGLSSLDPYFQCPGQGPSCAEVGSAGNGPGGSSNGGSAESGGAGNVSGTAPGGDAGNGGAPGSCTSSAECGTGTCFRGECGPAFELVYTDTPSDADPKNAQWIKFQIQIKNRTTRSVPLSALKVRYYYTPENVTSVLQILSVSTLPGSDSDVIGTFQQTQLEAPLQWTFLELGYDANAGTLGTGQTAGPIKVGIHDHDFGPGRFFQPDDFSYLDNAHLTLYENDALVSGTPPSTPPAN